MEIGLTVCWSVSLSVHLPICLSIGQLMCWSVCLFVCLSLFLFFWATPLSIYLPVCSPVPLCCVAVALFPYACGVGCGVVHASDLWAFVSLFISLSITLCLVLSWLFFLQFCVPYVCLPGDEGMRTCSHASLTALSSVFNVVYLWFLCVCLSSLYLFYYSAINSIWHSVKRLQQRWRKVQLKFGHLSIFAMQCSTSDSVHVEINLAVSPWSYNYGN